jgi:homoserine O-acetyltransferase/O-succinyltransferase
MGGMQTFQWLLAYPEFMKNAVSIMGTPSATSYDLLVWQAELRAIGTTQGAQEEDARRMKRLTPVHVLATRTPQYFISHITPEGFPQFLAETEKSFAKYNPNDWAWQLKAIMSGDLYRRFGKSAERAAGVVKAKLFAIVAQNDYMVNPGPSLALAGILKAKTLELSSYCGHFAFLCEQEKIREAVASFLAN